MLLSALCQGNCGILLLDADPFSNDLQCPKCGEDICFGTCCIPQNIVFSDRPVNNTGSFWVQKDIEWYDSEIKKYGGKQPVFLEWLEQNCTKCSSFSDISLKTDQVLVMPFDQEILVTCSKYGKLSNQKLYACEDFQYDFSKPEIVYFEKRASRKSQRFFIRIGTKLPIDQPKEIIANPEIIDDLTRSIYELVLKVYQDHGMTSLFTFVVARIHKDKGFSHQIVFRRIYEMISEGYLILSKTNNMNVLSLPPVFMNISDIKRKSGAI